MGKRELTGQTAIAAFQRKLEQQTEKGIPGTRVSVGQMESLRKGKYEEMAKEGAAHLRIFVNV
jgi:hypothetical protein